MLAKVTSCAVVGLEGALVEVEVDISPGLPSFTIVGLPDAAVQESKERVRAAIRNSGCQFPMRRITVNLAPADIRKAGPAYDLPIAIGILLSSEQVAAELPQSCDPSANNEREVPVVIADKRAIMDQLI
jgi:magnesium chelatase family protein